MKVGRFEMKPYNFIFSSEVIQPYDLVILVPFKKCLFHLPVSGVYDFFQGTFLILFSMSEFKNINNSIL